MRNTLLIVLISSLQVFAVDSYAQTKKISLDLKDATIKEVLYAIEKQSEFYFLFNSELIDVSKKVDITVQEEKVADILIRLFKNSEVDFLIKDRYIVLTPVGRSSGETFNLLAQQQGTVSGRVTDQNNQPLPGVTVVVKGTTQGTITDTNGDYTVTNLPAGATLVFSFVGMRSQEIVVGERVRIDVVMEEDVIGIEEVVAVGYGTKKKVNLTGSVANITNEQLEKRTVTKASQVLQGQMSGISVRQLSGNPGNNDASLLIRGSGTFSAAGTNPLVLVDGIESSIDNVDPNDIASVSILKDAASAAIYGSKAANGVILVETKKGISGEPVFTYSTYVGKQKPTTLVEMVDSWEYAEIYNETLANMGSQQRFTDEEIQKFKSGSDPINYPNFDHIDYLWGSGRGIETKHDISIRGGTKGTKYMFSAGYFDQQGLIKKNNSDRYNIRLNLDTELLDNLAFSFKIAGNINNSKEPSGPYTQAGLRNIIDGAMRMTNNLPAITPDGYYTRKESLHPAADLNSKSFLKNSSSNFYSNADMIWDITNELKIRGQFGYTFGISDYKWFVAKYPITPNYGIDLNKLTANWSKSNALTLQSIVEYNKIIKNHTIHLLGGISGQSYDASSLRAYRDEFPNNELYEIDAGATARGTQGGNRSQSSLMSYFGRANYDYNDKYLFEANFRYDGSSRFPEDNRWGLFPSFSAGWRISQENFFQNTVSWIDNFKLRGSWGELGNQSIGNYPYQDLVALGQNAPIGNELSAGAAVATIANKEITWETTRIVDFGLDMAFLDNKLAFTVDYFTKTTFNILYNVSVSRMLGASPSSTNAGEVENQGWDFDLNYRNTVGDFSYGVSGLFSVVHNKVLKLYGDLEQDINSGLFVGHPIGSQFGYVSDGLFVSDEEVANYATQPFSIIANAGGIKFVDISGPEGVPDGKVTSAYDRQVIGQPLPITTYALTFNGEYKNFDFNLLFQGEGGRKEMIGFQFFFPLGNDGNVQKDVYENRWTVENPDPDAKYPKMMFTSAGFYNSNKVDYWFRNATFIRLKNTQIGYSFPESILNKTFLKRARIYLTGENLLTLTGYYKGWDPEMNTAGRELFYPPTKLFVAGIDIDF